MVQPTQNNATPTSVAPSNALITQSDANATQARSFFIAEVVNFLFTSIGSALWFLPSLLIRAISDLTSSSIPVNEKTGAPVALHQLLDIVEQKAKITQGIYRVPASATDLDELTKQISKGENDGISEGMDAHLAACSVKKMLREMPAEQKVFPAEVPNLEELESDQKLAAAKTLISSITPQKKAFLSRLVNHIEAVSLFEGVNKMSKSNLVLMFAPNVFAQGADTDPMEGLAEMKKQNDLFTYVLNNRTALDI